MKRFIILSRATHPPWSDSVRPSLKCLLLSFLTSAIGAQAGPRPPRVEVVCPAAPIDVMIDGQHVLGYELHVTNFGRGALEFRALEVRNGDSSNARIHSYADSTLIQLLQPVGRDGGDAARLEPGQRTIVYLWIATPNPGPQHLANRFVFANLDTAQARRDGGTETSLSVVVVAARERPLRLRAPLNGGEWVVGSGPSNTSDHRRSVTAVDARAYISQRFAIDWVMVGANGNTYRGDEHRNESYWGFGQAVVAVADGEVVAAVDTIEDHTPHGPLPAVTLANIMGNFVTIRIAPNRYATYAHLRHGSLRVRPRQRINAGAVIAALGNTGQSTAPHLHFQITDRPSVLAAEGVPYVLRSFDFLGMGSDFEETKHIDVPRHNELPAENMVIRLP